MSADLEDPPIPDFVWNVEDGQRGWLTVETEKPKLFQWYNYSDPNSRNVRYISLDKVTGAWDLGDELVVYLSDGLGGGIRTDNKDTIARFWAEFDVMEVGGNG